MWTFRLPSPAHALLAVAAACSFLALPSPAGADDQLEAPNGILGARLSDDEESRARVYGELGFYGSDYGDAFPMVFGGGYRVMPQLELEARLPIAIGHVAIPTFGVGTIRYGGVGFGNLFLGANYLMFEDAFRLKVGAGLTFGPWTTNPSNDYVVALASSFSLHQDQLSLFAPETVGLTIPARIEFDPIERLLVSGDASFGLLIPTGGQDTEVVLNLAPGVAYVSPPFTAGLRMPLLWLLTESGDNVQVALEPYGRFDIGPGFVNGRFTMNLDTPYGFAFDTGGVWAILLGGGLSFL